MKISNAGSPNSYLKDFAPAYADLLQRILVFNPKKRITIQ